MSDKFEISDFIELARKIKPILDTHDVPPELHFSIISDTVFEYANLIDEKTGSSFHEEIYAAIESVAEQLAVEASGDYCVAFMDLVTAKNKKFELNILKSMLENADNLVMGLEVTLELRELEELDKVIDIDKRLKVFNKKTGGIKSLRFQTMENMDSDTWIDVPLNDSTYGSFSNDIAGISDCIRTVVSSWE